MYFAVNEELILIDFNPFISVRVIGKDNYYLIELREYKKNQNDSFWLDSFITTNYEHREVKALYCGIEFYMDFEINVYKFIENVGIVLIFTHRFNDRGKLVRFNLVSDSKDEVELWNRKILEYKNIHGCKTIVQSKFDSINKSHDFYHETSSITPYKTYNIGKFPKISKDFKSRDPRTPGIIHLGYWKTIWSYQNPRPWNNLNSEEIANDILGL